MEDLEIRRLFLDRAKEDLVGPKFGQEEIIDEWPIRRYQQGILWPSDVITEDNELENKSKEIASKITEKFKRVVKIGKEAFYKQAEMSVEQAYEYTANVMAENMIYEETNEGISAFIEKRTPEWTE